MFFRVQLAWVSLGYVLARAVLQDSGTQRAQGAIYLMNVLQTIGPFILWFKVYSSIKGILGSLGRASINPNSSRTPFSKDSYARQLLGTRENGNHRV